MSNPPAHLSHRTLLPGALLALLVTAGALFALAVVIAVGPDGPARLWLDGGGSTVNLQSRAGGQAGALTLPGSPVAFLTDAPTAGLKGAVTLAATPRTAAGLRSDTRVQRRAARLPSGSRPGQPAPSGTSPTTRVRAPVATAPRPVATPAPGSSVVKTRGHGKDTSSPVAVRKERVRATPAPAASGDAAQPAPAAVDKQPYRPSTAQDTSVGLADGVLTRVPPPPTSGG
jgi:hypothetical protein